MSNLSGIVISQTFAAASALIGVVIGGVVTFLIQRSAYQRERSERHHERLRDSYANWAAAILCEVDAIRNHLAFHNSVRDMADQTPEPVGMLFLQSAKEYSSAVLDASHREQVAFCQVRLVDADDGRVDRAHKVRLPIKRFVVETQSALSDTIREFAQTEERFCEDLSVFLHNVAKSVGCV